MLKRFQLMLKEEEATAKKLTPVGEEMTGAARVVESNTGVYPEALRRRLDPVLFHRALALE